MIPNGNEILFHPQKAVELHETWCCYSRSGIRAQFDQTQRSAPESGGRYFVRQVDEWTHFMTMTFDLAVV
jgi:hypothetical protein